MSIISNIVIRRIQYRPFHQKPSDDVEFVISLYSTNSVDRLNPTNLMWFWTKDADDKAS